jgi:hypothetical protein
MSSHFDKFNGVTKSKLAGKATFDRYLHQMASYKHTDLVSSDIFGIATTRDHKATKAIAGRASKSTLPTKSGGCGNPTHNGKTPHLCPEKSDPG